MKAAIICARVSSEDPDQERHQLPPPIKKCPPASVDGGVVCR